MRRFNYFRCIAALAILLPLLSCSKKDVVEQHPIKFGTEVSEPHKSQLATYGPITLAALKLSNDGFAVTTSGLPTEMSGVVVKYAKGAWSYSGTYYWPINEQQLVTFTAFAPAGIPEASLAPSGLTLAGYIPSNNTNKQVDIIYAPPAAYKRAGGDVSLNFTHILTQIIFSVTTDIPASDNPQIVSLQLSINNCKGNFDGNLWQVSPYLQSITVYNGEPIGSIPVLSKPIFVLPQPVAKGTNAKVTIKTKNGTKYKLVDLSKANIVKTWNKNSLVTYNIFCSKESFQLTASEKKRVQ